MTETNPGAAADDTVVAVYALLAAVATSFDRISTSMRETARRLAVSSQRIRSIGQVQPAGH